MSQTPHPRRLRALIRFLPLLVLLGAGILAAWQFGGQITPAAIAENRAAFAAFRDAHYLAAVLVFVLVYVGVVALSLPGATLASLTGGFLFGLFPGVFFNVTGAVGGSVLVFLAARSGLAPVIERVAGPAAQGQMARLRRALRAREWQVLFLMRLTPIVPFFVANLVPAAMGTRLSRFVITTALGIFPASLVVTAAGAGLGGLADQGRAPGLWMFARPEVALPLAGLMALAALPMFLGRRGNGAADDAH